MELLPDFWDKYPTLEGFYMKAPLIELPESLSLLTNLTQFSIEGTHLKKIPDWILNFKELEYLESFHSHKLEYLPRGMHTLTKLKEVVLIDSNIKNLPHDLALCPSLELIYMNYSTIQKLPADTRRVFGELIE